MNKRTTKLFIAILDNKAVSIDNTLVGLHTRLIKIEPTLCAYITLFRRFKKDDYFTLNVSGREYHFQKLS